MEVKTNKIDFEGATIYYWTAGDPKLQTLLFLHGWPGLKLLESGVIQELSKCFYVVAPNHPGLGLSDPLNKYSHIFNQYAELSHHILELEKRDKGKILVMGQSFGGTVASAFAYKYPQDTKALILVDSALGAGQKSKWMKFLYFYAPKINRVIPYLPKLLKSFVLKHSYAMGVTNWRSFNHSFTKRIEMVDDYNNLVMDSFRSGVKLIDKNYGDFPILFVWGDRDGREWSLYGSCHVDEAKNLYRKMKEEGRKVKFIEVDGGHTILYQKPKYVIGETIRSLQDFSVL